MRKFIMNFDQLKQEIFQIYRDYESNYAYGFCAGMIYASLICEKINESQASDLNNVSKDTFNFSRKS
jgi:hypothetical protein